MLVEELEEFLILEVLGFLWKLHGLVRPSSDIGRVVNPKGLSLLS